MAYNDVDSGLFIDPLSLTATILRPDTTELVITYPSDQFVRVDIGQYFVRYTGEVVGTHHYAITAQINAVDGDVRSGKFDVEPAL